MISIAIIGAGCSGTLVALQILENASSAVSLDIFETREHCGPGLAYSTTDSKHLLNVPAGRMSAFPEAPQDFLEWARLRLQTETNIATVTESTFLPRALYGEYLQERFERALTRQSESKVKVHRNEVSSLDVENSSVKIQFGSDASVKVDKAVLALGNWGASTPYPFLLSPQYQPFYAHDVWSHDVFANLGVHDSVLILGSGLTMVDMVLSLHSRNHEGPIVAISRRGLLSLSHGGSNVPSNETFKPTDEVKGSPLKLLREVRGRCLRSIETGSSWQQVVDSLRPHNQNIWRSWNVKQKRVFLRHAQPFWDIHRHRMAPEVREVFESMLERKQFSVMRGRVAGVKVSRDRCIVQVRQPRVTSDLNVDRILNCTGQHVNPELVSSSLVQHLMREEIISAGPCGLGFGTDENGALLERNGKPSTRLFTLGQTRKGNLWESTAVPEIRLQAAALAKTLLS